MGLLDEAIREHLELRRRHGADPDEVAREELDALSPVDPDREPVRSGSTTHASANGTARVEAGASVLFDGERDVDGVREGVAYAEAATREPSLTQETAEIDMRVVLGELEDAMSSEEAGGESRVRRAARADRTSLAPDRGAGSAFAAERGDSSAWETHGPRVRRVERRAVERSDDGERAVEAPRS